MADGRGERAKSARGRLRRPNLNLLYNRRVRPIRPGEYDFRIILIRPELPRHRRFTALNRQSVSLDWGDEGDTLDGTLTLMRSEPENYQSVPIERGHGIRLMVKRGDRFYRLWDMKVLGQPEVDRASGQVTLTLGDSLYVLKKAKRDWPGFTKRKEGPKKDGWTADEIARYVCRKLRVRIGKLAKGSERFELKEKDLKELSGLDVIRKAYAKEKGETGRKFIMRLRDGKLVVVPFHRPGVTYVIGGIEQSISFTGKPKSDTPATVIEAKGRLKGETGKDAKVETTVFRPQAVSRLGRVVKEKRYGKVRSKEHLRTLATRDLAGELKVTRTADITIPGIPFLEKGSAIKWNIKEPGWFGFTKLSKRPRDKSFCFVTSSSHSLTPTNYTTQISLTQTDPYWEDAKARDEKRRDKARDDRNARQNDQNGQNDGNGQNGNGDSG